MIERIDTWIGKTLFVPLIIRICQLLGCTQHRFHRVCWFIATMVAFGFLSDGLADKLIFGALAIVLCIWSALAGDHLPSQPRRWFRILVVAFVLLDATMTMREVYNLLILAAEYASTIRTIPPLEDRKREPKRAAVRA